MKLTVLGAGNAGCLTALHFSCYTKHVPDFEVELIYDKNIPPEKVGQATLLDPPLLLWDALNLNWYDNPIKATPKTGILFENWGKVKDKFFHPLAFPTVSLHYDPAEMQKTVLESGQFKVTDNHIKDYSEVDSDYIFDCRGKPNLKTKEDWEFYDELRNPLNACILGRSNEKEPDVYWTRTVATPDGWCFVIPNTTHTTSYGYLFNSDITSEEEAKKNFNDLFGIESDDIVKFQKYVATNPIIDERIILGGNKLFFLEPLEATAVQAHLQWARYVYDWMISNILGYPTAMSLINRYIHEIENFVIWHYQFGSKYDTPFWEYAKTFEIHDYKFHKMVDSISGVDLNASKKLGGKYGQWKPWNFKYWADGVGA